MTKKKVNQLLNQAKELPLRDLAELKAAINSLHKQRSSEAKRANQYAMANLLKDSENSQALMEFLSKLK